MNLRVLKQIIRSPFFIIALVVCAANWELLFGLKSLQWDALNFWHPWRYFISECYKNGIVPLWDPFTQSGYPVHGDLQGPAYNPEAIVTLQRLPCKIRHILVLGPFNPAFCGNQIGLNNGCLCRFLLNTTSAWSSFESNTERWVADFFIYLCVAFL